MDGGGGTRDGARDEARTGASSGARTETRTAAPDDARTGAPAGAGDQARDQGRELSTAVVAFHEAVGAHLGVTAVDQRALALIAGRGPMTAGALAKEINLTPGAVTGVADRLERAGLVRREPDPEDRRRVVITAVPGAFGQVFAGLSAAMAELSARYTPEEQRVIGDWVVRTVDVLKEQTRRLTEGRSPGPR